MLNQTAKRYPGPRAFQASQRTVFFGREKDIRELYKTMRVHVLTVLHGKSGLGKSSLLNAGVIPEAETTLSFLAHTMRFFAFDHTQHTDPSHIIKDQLSTLVKDKQYFASFASDQKQMSLWQTVKSVQWANRDKKGLLLVFDQFEELFSYPPELVEAFAKQFSELVNNRMPESFQQKLYDAYSSDPAFGEKNQDALAFIDHAPELHIIVGIRSDRMAQLEKLSAWLPQILTNRYELLPLTRENAEEAIVKPATQAGQFISPPFTYAPDALHGILDYLTSERTRDVESTQLQVICQYLEDKVKTPGQVISLPDLGNIEDIYTNHYESILQKLDPGERPKAQHLIENELIYEKEERRLSIYEGQITGELGVPVATLNKLVDSHLLRAEPHSSGGYVYEISHDSLVAPILKVKREADAIKNAERIRAEREAFIQKERAALAEEQKERERNRLRLFVIVTSILSLIAAYGWYSAWKTNSSLEGANNDLKFKNAANDSLLLQVRLKSDSLADANRIILEQQYEVLIQKGENLIEQTEYKLAIQEFQSALLVNAPNKNKGIIEERIAYCETLAAKKYKFDQILKKADQAFKQKDLINAFRYYQAAKALGYDDETVRPQLAYTEKALEYEFNDLLKRADAYLYRGNSPEWACKLMNERIEPIALALSRKKDKNYLKIRQSLDARLCEQK